MVCTQDENKVMRPWRTLVWYFGSTSSFTWCACASKGDDAMMHISLLLGAPHESYVVCRERHEEAKAQAVLNLSDSSISDGVQGRRKVMRPWHAPF